MSILSNYTFPACNISAINFTIPVWNNFTLPTTMATVTLPKDIANVTAPTATLSSATVTTVTVPTITMPPTPIDTALLPRQLGYGTAIFVSYTFYWTTEYVTVTVWDVDNDKIDDAHDDHVKKRQVRGNRFATTGLPVTSSSSVVSAPASTTSVVTPVYFIHQARQTPNDGWDNFSATLTTTIYTTEYLHGTTMKAETVYQDATVTLDHERTMPPWPTPTPLGVVTLEGHF